jgi:DNA-directed RNA polymerase specialized sigma24 family protein
LLGRTYERLRQITDAIRRLSPLERRVLLGVVNGRRYEELGPPKVVDNALQRARRHLREECA